MTKELRSVAFFMLSLFLFGQTKAQSGAPAFPGAEGHGRYVSGGRNPSTGATNVIHVTNLNDSGTGSLRAAVSGNAYKTIVFDVGGVIALNSELTIGDNTTIAGQTAPDPGITIRYYTVRPGANNIIRFIRIRRGQERDVDDGADALWQRNKTGIILDHCSFSWSIDEVASFYDNNNFTMQWCTIGESLLEAGHNKGAHGYGGIWGGKLASFHHNLICHVANRSPRFCGARYDWTGYTNNQLYSEYNWGNAVQAENVDLRNCVVYNCGNGCYGGPGGGQVNMVNNYFKTGPSASTTRITTVSVATSENSGSNCPYYDLTSRYYISGNQLDGTSNKDWGGVGYDSGTYTIDGDRYCKDVNHYYGSNVTYKQNTNGEDCVKIKLDSEAPKGEVTTHSASAAFDKVMAYAGASLIRDNVDARYMQEAQSGTATYTGSVSGKRGLIDRVSDCNGYTESNFGTGSRPDGYDTDRDGMPDEWESKNGLNPNDASDAQTYTLDTEKGYYTNLEVYLSSVVESIMKNENKDAQSSVNEYYPKSVSTQTITATATYALTAGETFTSGQTVNVESDGETVATVTYGVEGGADFGAASANGSVSGFAAFTAGNGVNGSATSGTVYYIKPEYDGKVEVAVVLNADKSFYILEDGVALDGYDGITESTKYYGTYSFNVKGGSTYAVYCTGSKLGFYGFNYTWTATAEEEEPHEDPEGVTANATYLLYEGDTFDSGETVDVTYNGDVIATVQYGFPGGDAFTAAKSNGLAEGFVAATDGNGTNGSSTGGTVYLITPVYNGTIDVAVVLNAGKSFYILEDDVALPDYNGITSAEKYYGTYTFDVKAGSTYKVYCTGSKLGFYGFNYTWTIPTISGSIVWPVGDEASATVAEELQDYVSNTTVKVGSGLTCETASYTAIPDCGTMVKYQPSTGNAGTTEDVMIEYTVSAADGKLFTPTSVSFDAVKVGTDNAYFSWSYTIDGVESAIQSVPAATILRNSNANADAANLNHTAEISGKACDVFTLRFYISNVANNKQMCIGNVVVNGTVSASDKQTIEKGIYDYYVKSDDDLVAAINAANTRSDKSARYRIFLYDGTYTLPLSTTETIAGGDGNTYPSPITYIKANNISFIGESRDGVVITNDLANAGTYTNTSVSQGQTSVYDGISKSDVLQISNGISGIYFQDLTVKSGIPDGLGRNIALQDRGTKNIYKNVCLWGYQDTWTSNNDNGLYYFEGGLLRGRTDFLCGKGDAFFNETVIQVCMNTGGYIAVPSKSIKYGYVFSGCTINGESTSLNTKYYLGRPWGSGTPVALWINTTMNIIPSSIGWAEMSNGWPKRFAEYNSRTSDGVAVDLSGRKTTFNSSYTNNPVLTAAEAAEASDMSNMFGSWVPTDYTEQAPSPKNVVLTGTVLTWDDSNYAFCWAVVKDGHVVGFTQEPTYTVDDSNATYSVRAANAMGGLGVATEAVKSTVVTLSEDEDYDGSLSGTFDVELTRTFKEGMNTLVLPFATDATELFDVTGMEFSVYTVSKIKGGAIVFDEQADGRMAANKPYLVVVTGADGHQATYTFSDKTLVAAADGMLTTEGENITMTGVYQYTEFPDGDPTIYMIQDSKAVYAASTVWFKPTRAYFRAETQEGVKSLDLNFEADDTPTGIGQIGTSDTSQPQVYDLSGRRVARPSKGLYIVNGKKLIVK